MKFDREDDMMREKEKLNQNYIAKNVIHPLNFENIEIFIE